MSNRRNRAQWRVAGSVALCLAFAIPGQAWTQVPVVGVPATTIPQPAVQMVQELLEQEAARALAEEKRKSTAEPLGVALSSTPAGAAVPQAADPSTPAPAPVPRLLAITGVGSQLGVAVDVGGRRAQYRAGSEKPIAGSDLGLLLQNIVPPCASFLDQSQETATYCLTQRTP